MSAVAHPETLSSTSNGADRSVALVHDYLNQPGGAERVVLEMARGIWPEAPLYTSLYRAESTFPEFQECDIRTSFLDHVPVDAHFRVLLPLYPAAFSSFGVFEEDLVISSSSGWAHAVRTAPGSVHIVYCYAPARWLYNPQRYLESSVKTRLLTPVIAPLRRWDQEAAKRPDRYIVISQNVRERVKAAYGIDADVVYPPVETDRFRVGARGDRLLVVSRLLAYKRIDLVVRAANRLGMGLDIVGIGPALNSLKAIAGPTVKFHGRLPDSDITDLFESCYAFCLPGEEDFGIAPIEANAAGKPVVAYAAGGALETLQSDFSAVFFHEQTVEALLDALRRADRLDTSPPELARSAERFSREVFHVSLQQAIDRLYAARNGNGNGNLRSVS